MTLAGGIPVITAAQIEHAMSRAEAVAAIERALRAGFDIENDHERIFAPLAAGDFLLMPSQSATAAGIDAVAGDRSAAASADVIVTATSSASPVLWLADIRPGAAIGSHGRESRELGDDLVRSADVVVEARSSAERENGNLAVAPGLASAATNLRELVRGELHRRPGVPAVYTGVGMAWEDLAVGEGIMEITRGASAQEESP